MKIEYLARDDNNTLICIATDTDLYGSRFFIGTGSPLREIPLNDNWDAIYRMRDGGTTGIITHEGEFQVPSPLRHNPYEPGAVTYQHRPFTLMDITTTAELTDEGLTLR